MTPALFSLSSPPLLLLLPPPPEKTFSRDSIPDCGFALQIQTADAGLRKKSFRLLFTRFPSNRFFPEPEAPPFFPSPAQQQNPSGAFPFSSGRGCRIFSPPPSLPGLTFSHGRDMVSNAEMHGKEENWNRHNCGKSQAPLRGKRRPRFRWCGGYAPFLPPCSQDLEQSHLRRNE